MDVLWFSIERVHSFLIQMRDRFAAQLCSEIEFVPEGASRKIGPRLHLSHVRFVIVPLIFSRRIKSSRLRRMKSPVAVRSVFAHDQRTFRKSFVLIV